MDITSMLNQTAVYWGTPTQDGYGGFTYATPVEVAVRWMAKNEKFISQSGAEQVSSAVVISETDFELGGRLYLGTLADLSTAEKAAPHTISGCWEIRGYNKTPSIKADQFLRRAFL